MHKSNCLAHVSLNPPIPLKFITLTKLQQRLAELHKSFLQMSFDLLSHVLIEKASFVIKPSITLILTNYNSCNQNGSWNVKNLFNITCSHILNNETNSLSYEFLYLLHLWLKFITFMVSNLLHLWLIIITFMVGITFMVDFLLHLWLFSITFMGDNV